MSTKNGEVQARTVSIQERLAHIHILWEELIEDAKLLQLAGVPTSNRLGVTFQQCLATHIKQNEKIKTHLYDMNRPRW